MKSKALMIAGVELCDAAEAPQDTDDRWEGYTETELGFLSPDKMPNCITDEIGNHWVLYNNVMYTYIMPKTSSKKFRQKIRDIKVWLYANRDQPLKKLMGMLNLKLIGHYRYYGISFNGRMISNYKQQVRELLFKVLNRRSDRKSYTREGFIEMLKYYPLAMPKIYVSLF